MSRRDSCDVTFRGFARNLLSNQDDGHREPRQTLCRRRSPICSVFVRRFWGRRWAQSSYITRSQRSCGLRPQFPPRAVSYCFAPSPRPISADPKTRLCAFMQGVFVVQCSPSISQVRGLSFFNSAANRGSPCKLLSRGPTFIWIKPSSCLA